MKIRDKRFELKSFNFQDLNGVLYDNLFEKELRLSLYGIIDLLNEVSQGKYDIVKLQYQINEQFDEILDKGDSE